MYFDDVMLEVSIASRIVVLAQAASHKTVTYATLMTASICSRRSRGYMTALQVSSIILLSDDMPTITAKETCKPR